MSDDTILGGPPSTTGDGSDADGHRDREDGPLPIDPPGDAATALSRGRLYALLALGFERPGEDLETAIDEGAYVDRLVESAAAIDDDVAAAATAVGESLADADVGSLHDEWASLFGVEEGRTVSPYELTYLPGPLLTTVRQLADVRGFYDAFGLETAPGRNDRGDHVCFLTEFLGHCCLREAALRRAGDDEGVAIVVDARRSFIEDHLGRWYWRFAAEVSQYDDGFYAALADLLAALVETEIDRLDLDPNWVPDAPEVTEWNEDVFGNTGRSCGGCGADVEGLGERVPESAVDRVPTEPGGPTADDGVDPTDR